MLQQQYVTAQLASGVGKAELYWCSLDYNDNMPISLVGSGREKNGKTPFVHIRRMQIT